jgi:hypothetical protein
VGAEIHGEERRRLEGACLGERGVFELRRSLMAQPSGGNCFRILRWEVLVTRERVWV